MIANGSASLGDLIVGVGYLISSAEARATYRRFVSIGAVLRSAFDAADDVVRVEIRRRPKPLAWAAVALLFAVVVVQWVSYSGPALMEAMRALGRRCGF
jgi:hypothetical protein